MAGAEITLKVELNKFPEVGSRIRAQLSKAIRKAGFDIEAHAKNVVPVRTGNLKNSIQTEIKNDLLAQVQVGAEYGIYVEYGTRKMSARPYLRPAVEEVREPFVEACKQAMGADV
jgi:HK97 gp10 family phage protein